MSLAFAVPPFAVWHDELWDTILDLSALLEEGSWVLVGGQAVVAHALARDVDPVRGVIDPVGRLLTTEAAYPTVLRSLRYLGFEAEGVQPPMTAQFRYRREAESIRPRDRPQVWTVQVVGVTAAHGGAQALSRRTSHQVTKGLRAPLVPVSDLLSTILYEARQFAVDTADPFIHARDAAFLVSLIDDPVAEARRLTPADRRALRVLDAAVGGSEHHVWSRVPSGRDAFQRWTSLLEIPAP